MAIIRIIKMSEVIQQICAPILIMAEDNLTLQVIMGKYLARQTLKK